MPYFKTENSNAENIKYDNTKSVKEAIDEIKASSSSNPTASSVTFDNTDIGLNATNVQDAVTEVNGNFTGLIKYKDYIKTDAYIANEISYVANLDDDGISGYTPFFAQKINMETDCLIYPIITNYTRNYVKATYLMVHNLASNSLSSRTDVIRVFFISNKVVK